MKRRNATTKLKTKNITNFKIFHLIEFARLDVRNHCSFVLFNFTIKWMESFLVFYLVEYIIFNACHLKREINTILKCIYYFFLSFLFRWKWSIDLVNTRNEVPTFSRLKFQFFFFLFFLLWPFFNRRLFA